jgi:UDPglucose--hexose-1-phosphate uridylyltransferase
VPEIRKDPTSSRWAVISTERSKRPGDFDLPPVTKKAGFCPFCEGNESSTPPETYSVRDTGKPDEPGWKIRVVPNKFPALKNEGEPTRHTNEIFSMIEGTGIHEVIVETPEHNKKFFELGDEEFYGVISAYKKRLIASAADPRIEYTLIFRNSGLLAGASLEHPHSQLIALPLIPVALEDELKTSKTFHALHDKCLFCEMIAREITEGSRIISTSNDFVALSPYAPRFPFEMWVFPKKHASHFESMDDSSIRELSVFFKTLMKHFASVLDDPPYNFMLHTAPARSEGLNHFHWHFEITPCLTHIAGFERGSGFYINPTPPEEAAKHLKF